MRFKQVGNKRDSIFITIHNADTVKIAVGTPCVFVMNGTNDGLDVVLPSTAAADNYSQGFFAGVADRTMNVGDYAEACVFGIFNNIVLEQRTRAASTNSWSTVAAMSVGQYLSLDTANNAFTTVASTLPLAQSATANSYVMTLGYPAVKAILGQSFASVAGLATSTNNSLTVSTIAAEAFIRVL